MNKLLHSIILDRKNNSIRSFIILLFYRLTHDAYIKINYLTQRLKDVSFMYVCMYAGFG